MKWTPFTAHVKVTPTQGKRFVYIRSLQKLARELYDSLKDNPNLSIAAPGGGGSESITGHDHSAISQLNYGTAAKPQFGNFPAQLMITGFYKTYSDNNQTNEQVSVFSANQVYTSAASAPSTNIPKSFINTEVASLKTILDAAIASPNLPVVSNAKVFRIDYSGVVFGDRGYHFPL